METAVKADIEKNFTRQLGGLLAAVRQNASPAALTTPAKIREFARNISASVSSLINPAEWLSAPEQGLVRGLARNMDVVIGHDRHLIMFPLPPLPIPIIIGPVPIPFAGMIRVQTDVLSRRGLRRIASLSPAQNTRPVYINHRRAASGPQKVFSFFPHQGPLPFFPIITILGGKRRPECTVHPSGDCHIFINGQRAIGFQDAGAGSCQVQKIVVFSASGNVKMANKSVQMNF